LKAAERLVSSRLRIRRKESLYLAGDRFGALYTVRHGFIKTTAIIENGRDQVTAFSMAGEVLGLDGIDRGVHSGNARALEDSEVCAISFARLQNLAAAIPRLQRRLHMLMSREIVREHGMMLLLGSMNADQRMAMFLLDLSQRFAAQGRSASAFNLRLTRDDIGSYLGLTVGTISRMFTKFDEAGLIAVRGKSVRILDKAGLERVGGQALP
jgi:CRP/FNR family transcriptional regulator